MTRYDGDDYEHYLITIILNCIGLYIDHPISVKAAIIHQSNFLRRSGAECSGHFQISALAGPKSTLEQFMPAMFVEYRSIIRGPTYTQGSVSRCAAAMPFTSRGCRSGRLSLPCCVGKMWCPRQCGCVGPVEVGVGRSLADWREGSTTIIWL